MVDYESTKVLNDYLLFHYGSAEQNMPWAFVGDQYCHFVERVVGHFSAAEVERSLDIGCAVGAASFLLSKNSAEVIGLDFSQGFIDAANQLKEHGTLAIQIQQEGEIYVDSEVSLPCDALPERVSFQQGDAMNLPENIGSFDRVHVSNLLCRLPDPKKLLERLPSLVNSGGELVLATPFSWLEEFTPRENWPEGDSWAWLSQQLESHFSLVSCNDEPFLIREHVRKFQLGISKVSVWRRK